MTVRFSLFDSFSYLRYGISHRHDGSMRIAEHQSLVSSARRAYFARVGIDVGSVASAFLVHGSHVASVTRLDAGEAFRATDGLVSADPALFLSVTVADCMPVYFFDPVRSVVGIAHAGWRGIVRGIVPEVLRVMTEEHGCSAADILVGLGPGIRRCHFEITDEIREQFPEGTVLVRENKIFVDLVDVLVRQLHGAGVEHVEDSGICTFCHPEEYFSYRRDKPDVVASVVAWIGVDNA